MNTRGLVISMSVGVATLLVSCSSPKSQGEKLGKEYCDCQKEYANEREKVYQEFLAKFDSYGFKTRTEARQKWQDLQNEATRKFEECNGKVEEKVKKARAKFPTSADDLMGDLNNAMRNPQKYIKEAEKRQKEFANNQKKASEFNDALRSATNKCEVQNNEQDNTKIQEKIMTIKPQKPDEARLKQNLVGRRILEQSGGYFGNRWAWQIASIDEVKNIKIEKEEKVGEDYELDVHLVLQKEQGSQYEADLTLICVLGQEDDWKIDFIKTKDIRIVKTGRYDDCITKEIKKSYWNNYLQFTNSCDVSLIVGGQMLGSDGEWIKFSTNVNANSTGSTSYHGKEYKIDFIERQ